MFGFWLPSRVCKPTSNCLNWSIPQEWFFTFLTFLVKLQWQNSVYLRLWTHPVNVSAWTEKDEEAYEAYEYLYGNLTSLLHHLCRLGKTWYWNIYLQNKNFSHPTKHDCHLAKSVSGIKVLETCSWSSVKSNFAKACLEIEKNEKFCSSSYEKKTRYIVMVGDEGKEKQCKSYFFTPTLPSPL